MPLEEVYVVSKKNIPQLSDPPLFNCMCVWGQIFLDVSQHIVIGWMQKQILKLIWILLDIQELQRYKIIPLFSLSVF